ncbi:MULTISPECIES: DUF3105 domain-containing protein [unclassified Nocardia]|uniref:DUF3105 domain-containing protein n=1 Tax=unclassified Nocardia TaxID=2637762 RepID=UPI001C4F42E5|nr:DUF3105 domain-containing protein [Nocardia sp. MH4]
MRNSDTTSGARRARTAAVGIAVATLLTAGCATDGKVDGTAIASTDAFVPTADNQDPSREIPGVEITEFPPGLHVTSTQRVAYPVIPPLGGPHDSRWAACDGVVYATGVRTENVVHSLEHGAVWIAYNPDKVSAADQAALAARVTNKPYTLMSPIPGMAHPISLQSWGHQLKPDSAADPRIDQFILALRENPYTTPEPGATCSSPLFDRTNPPPFDPTAPGPDAVDPNSDGSATPGLPTPSPGSGR